MSQPLEWAVGSGLSPLATGPRSSPRETSGKEFQTGTIPLKSHEPGLIGPVDRAR